MYHISLQRGNKEFASKEFECGPEDFIAAFSLLPIKLAGKPVYLLDGSAYFAYYGVDIVVAPYEFPRRGELRMMDTPQSIAAWIAGALGKQLVLEAHVALTEQDIMELHEEF